LSFSREGFCLPCHFWTGGLLSVFLKNHLLKLKCLALAKEDPSQNILLGIETISSHLGNNYVNLIVYKNVSIPFKFQAFYIHFKE
jgi:hypothetical protein